MKKLTIKEVEALKKIKEKKLNQTIRKQPVTMENLNDIDFIEREINDLATSPEWLTK